MYKIGKSLWMHRQFSSLSEQCIRLYARVKDWKMKLLVNANEVFLTNMLMMKKNQVQLKQSFQCQLEDVFLVWLEISDELIACPIFQGDIFRRSRGRGLENVYSLRSHFQSLPSIMSVINLLNLLLYLIWNFTQILNESSFYPNYIIRVYKFLHCFMKLKVKYVVSIILPILALPLKTLLLGGWSANKMLANPARNSQTTTICR